MSLSILNNIPSLSAQNQLSLTGAALQQHLQRLASGSRINSGADDAAGLAIADGLSANITALTQSARNATDGVGMLQVADGALSQITTLLNRAVTLATEASTGTVTNTQRTALNNEFTSIKNEIDAIGGKTTYNGQAIFASGASLTVYMSDSTSAGTNQINVTLGVVDKSHLGTYAGTTTAVDLSSVVLTSDTAAQSALTAINSAIAGIAGLRGNLGAGVNQLQAANNVMNNQVQNLAAAEDSIRAADIGKEVAAMTKYNILQQTGMAALQQSNNMQQSVLKLLQ